MPDLREPLTPQELKFYGSIFKTLDPTNSGSVSGGVAKPLLEASGLPLSTLGEVWNIADIANKGYLDTFEFCIAMRLIAHAQTGQTITEESKAFVAPLAKFGHIQQNSTGTAVPQSSSRVSSNSSTRITSPSLIVPVLSPTQASNFGLMFDKTAVNGILPGGQAKSIFMKARLPVTILEQVWDLVDQRGDGQLTRSQFIVAMHLIQCCMNKSLTTLPAALSDQLWNVAKSASTTNPAPATPSDEMPQPKYTTSSKIATPPSPLKKQISGPTNLNTWIMSDQQKSQYGAIFDTLDTKHDSFISSATVANFLMTSKLPNETLANIWELSNLDQSENFTKQEFSIAMYLVQKTLAGYELPEHTPSELIKTSGTGNYDINISQIPAVAPQSFAAAQDLAAPQRSASHMDDLLGIFKTADQVAPSPPPPPPHHYQQKLPQPQQQLSQQQFTQQAAAQSPPSIQQFGSSFGREMQQKPYLSNHVAEEEESSDDDDDAPENLDLPRLRGSATIAPEIPGRSSKPHFDQSNYDAIKNINQNNSATMFSSQPASGFTNTSDATAPAFTAGTAAAAAGVGALAGAAVGFTGSAIAGAFSGANDQSEIKAINNQIAQASVDIANHSNEVNSLSKQTSIISSKKEKAQNDLSKILKTKESVVAKLSQLKALNEKESQQVIEVQNLMIKSKGESDELENQLRIVEANYHAEETKKEQLQQQYDEAQKQNQVVKERLGTLNAESTDLKQQIEELSARLNQSNNLLAVTQQQVVTQEQENENLKIKLSDLSNTIFQVDSKHQSLLARLSSLNNENLELHDNHTDLSIQSATKNVDYSQALAEAASKGLAHEDDIEDTQTGEVPTAELEDDFDKVFNLAPAQEAKSVTKNSAVSNSSEFTSPSSDFTSPTELSSTFGASAATAVVPTAIVGGAAAALGALALGHAQNQSETSSIQNNPSQSVRNDTGDELNSSDASTIENSPLSSQVLPEGQPEVTEFEEDKKVADETPEPQGESFELVERPVEKETAAGDSEDAATTGFAPVPTAFSEEKDDEEEADVLKPIDVERFNSHVTEEEVDGVLAKSNIEEEFPAIQTLENDLDDSSASSSSESFEDAPIAQSNSELAETKPIKNPFNKNSTSASEAVTTEQSSSSIGRQTDDMFDDLGLEDAAIDDTDAFGAQPQQDAGLGGFSFSGLEPAPTTDGDDWEQVFAGFGNDPNIAVTTQPVFTSSELLPPAHPSIETTTSGQYTNAQKLAIDELSAMGFDKDDLVIALEKNNWNIDDASNYLIDK